MSWPCWFTDIGRFSHKVVTRPAVSLAQDRESSPARTGGLTTMLRHQHCVIYGRVATSEELTALGQVHSKLLYIAGTQAVYGSL